MTFFFLLLLHYFLFVSAVLLWICLFCAAFNPNHTFMGYISRWSLSQYCNNNRSALSLFVCVYLCTCWSASLICPILYCLNCLCYKERENVPFWWKMHKIKKRAKAACLRELPSCVFIRNSDIVVWLCIQEDRNELEQRKLFFPFHLFCSWVKRAKRNNLMLLSLRAAARISSSI